MGTQAQHLPDTPGGRPDRDAASRSGWPATLPMPPRRAPVLTTGALSGVIDRIDLAFLRADRDGDPGRLARRLATASDLLPHGRRELLPLWLDAVAEARGRGPLGPAYRRVRQELAAYLRDAVAGGLFTYRRDDRPSRIASPATGTHGLAARASARPRIHR